MGTSTSMDTDMAGNDIIRVRVTHRIHREVGSWLAGDPAALEAWEAGTPRPPGATGLSPTYDVEATRAQWELVRGLLEDALASTASGLGPDILPGDERIDAFGERAAALAILAVALER